MTVLGVSERGGRPPLAGIRSKSAALKLAVALLSLALMGVEVGGQPIISPEPTVAYPEGFREWVHVKSALSSPAHANFSSGGGFHHIYANPEGMRGYRTRVFPEGSVVVFDWLEMRDEAGLFVEGPRRRLDVMVKDAARFEKTGGWGFQRFTGDSKTERAVTPPPQQCFACHERLRGDGLVLSTYRP